MVMSSCGPAERFPVHHGDNGVMELRGNGLSEYRTGVMAGLSAPPLQYSDMLI
jgi:hypothetical protein